MVQTFKKSLKSSIEPWSTLLDKFLFSYRVTPQSTTGVSPAELMFKRRLRCRLDLLHPSDEVGARVIRKQEAQKVCHGGSRSLNLETQTPVVIRNYVSGSKWLPNC